MNAIISRTNFIILPASNDLPTSAINPPGSLDKIPTAISKDIPLPIPFSVILSPNHTANIDPATKTRIVCVHQKAPASGGIAPLDSTYIDK